MNSLVIGRNAIFRSGMAYMVRRGCFEQQNDTGIAPTAAIEAAAMRRLRHLSLTFAQGTVPIGAVSPLSPALKLSVGTYLCVAVTSYTQCAAVSTCRGLTRAPVHHS